MHSSTTCRPGRKSDLVQVDAEWVLRFNAILELLRRVLGIAACSCWGRGAGRHRQYHPP